MAAPSYDAMNRYFGDKAKEVIKSEFILLLRRECYSDAA